MEDYKQLIERLKTDAEWAEANEWESPICLCDDLIGAIQAIEALTAELVDERHRHDRLQDFEVAEAKELERIKAERDAAVSHVGQLTETDVLLAKKFNEKLEELEKVTKERDALIDEIRGMCNLCAHYNKGNGDSACPDCSGGNFVWRGSEGKR